MSVADYLDGSEGPVVVVAGDLICNWSDNEHDFTVTIQFNDGPPFTSSLDPIEPPARPRTRD